VQNKELISRVSQLLEQQNEIDFVLDQQGKIDHGINHQRSGDLIAVAKPNAWFSYYYWLDDKKAPDFARTVDIHRKPGYDPVELFLDPKIKWPMAKIAWKLIKKKLGFRTLLDVIPLDSNLVKGSHGALTANKNEGAIYICSEAGSLSKEQKSHGLKATEIKEALLNLIGR
jgi:hypothetical protein